MPESVRFGEVSGSRYAAPEQQLPRNVEAFKAMIGRTVVDARVITVNHGQEFPGSYEHFDTTAAVDAVSKSLGDGYGRLDRLYTATAQEAEAISGSLQNVAIARTTTAETSAHQVFFGKLVGSGGALRVAVKPFIAQENATYGFGKVAKEWANTITARARGFGAFAPVGFIPTREGGYMLSRRRDDVDPLDGVNWEGVLSDPVQNGYKIDDLRKVAPLLADMHHNGIMHGDPQLKNFVIDQRGRVEPIDFESAHIEPLDQQYKSDNIDSLQRRMKRDILVLFASLARPTKDAGVGLLSGMTPAAQASYFQELVLQPYIKKRLDLLEQSTIDENVVLELLGGLEEEVVEYIETGELQNSLNRTRQRITA